MWKRVPVLAGLAVLLAVCAAAPPTTKATERPIKILNESGSKVEIYWVHPQTGALSIMSTPNVLNGASFNLNSFIGHEFEIRELPSSKTGTCKGEEQTCRTNYLAVTENSEQTATLNKDFEIVFEDDQIRAKQEAQGLVKECQDAAKEKLTRANGDAKLTMLAMDDLVACVETGVAETLSKANEELAFQGKIRRDMAAQMENYTCVDIGLNTSDPVEVISWSGAKDRKKRSVQVMFDRPASKVHVIEDFINEDECKAMEEAAASKLHRASVADGKGGSHFSEHRKAMQAGIKVPWAEEAKGNAIARLSRRVYDYAEHVLGLGINEFGQEDLMSIQYFGRGENDTAPDRYTPHCDGECTGMPFKSGNRMATMVLYCTVPAKGGHTNFRNAGVHVKPQQGNGIFFSYIDPEKLIMDNGFTEHSGCPVFEGEKKIVTQWIRLGVDEENPWDSFNTLGIKKDEAEEE